MKLNLNSTNSFFKNALTKGDIILVAFVCFVIALLFAPSFFSADEVLKAHIYFGGEEVETVTLFSDSDIQKLKIGGCTILIENDGVSFVESECKDKLCIKKGKLKRKGDTMACVPQRVVVTVRGEKQDDFDIATY